MKDALLFLLSAAFALTPGTSSVQTLYPEKPKLVHFVVINMSGSSRVVYHHGDIIPLPVATRASLQVPAGDRIEVRSETDRRINITIAVKDSDEGRVLPIR